MNVICNFFYQALCVACFSSVMDTMLHDGFALKALKDLLKSPGDEDSDSDSEQKVGMIFITCVVFHIP